jgi:hypothetical protein
VVYGKGEILADQVVVVALLPDNETPRPGVDFISIIHVWLIVVFYLGKEPWEKSGTWKPSVVDFRMIHCPLPPRPKDVDKDIYPMRA